MVFSSTHNLSQVQFENLLYAFGSPNYGTQRSLCFNAMIVANLMTYGMEEPERIYDDQLQYIILTGRNLMEAISTSETGELSAAIIRGVEGRLSRPALHQDRRQSDRVAADQAGHRPGVPSGAAERHHRRRPVQPRLRRQSTPIGFDELAQEVAAVHARMGSADHRNSRRHHPAHRPRIRRRRAARAGAQRLAHVQFRQLLPDAARDQPS